MASLGNWNIIKRGFSCSFSFPIYYIWEHAVDVFSIRGNLGHAFRNYPNRMLQGTVQFATKTFLLHDSNHILPVGTACIIFFYWRLSAFLSTVNWCWIFRQVRRCCLLLRSCLFIPSCGLTHCFKSNDPLSPQYRHGHLDHLQISSSRCNQWEDTVLSSFASREGWVSSNEASGTSTWNDEDDNASAGGGFGVFSGISSLQQQQNLGTQQQQPTVSSSSDHATSDVFPTGEGRALGSATRRPGQVDPRQARLQAIERRSGETSTNNTASIV